MQLRSRTSDDVGYGNSISKQSLCRTLSEGHKYQHAMFRYVMLRSIFPNSSKLDDNEDTFHGVAANCANDMRTWNISYVMINTHIAFGLVI